MSEKLYLLVKDDYDTGIGESYIKYVCIGSKDEVHARMEQEYNEYLNNEWGTEEWRDEWNGYWDDVDINELGAGLYGGYDRHIDWWMVEAGQKPDKGALYLVVRGDSYDTGGVGVKVIATADLDRDAQYIMAMAYGEELADPSTYGGWDAEYCGIDRNGAYATIETRDAMVDFKIIEAVDRYGRDNYDICRGFEY